MILSVGMPRAGSGWYYNLTQDLVKASGGEDARIIRSLGQASDHPVALTFPEGHYLKGLVCKVT